MHLSRSQSAVGILKERVSEVIAYLEEKGETMPPGVLRQIASLCYRLPSLDPRERQSEFEPVIINVING